jgi:hypothetical protein
MYASECFLFCPLKCAAPQVINAYIGKFSALVKRAEQNNRQYIAGAVRCGEGSSSPLDWFRELLPSWRCYGTPGHV